MTTRFSIQRDKRSAVTYGYVISDTKFSAITGVATSQGLAVPAGVHLVMISVSGSMAYVEINGTPVLPIVGAFTARLGHQINNGAVKLLLVNPGDTLNVITVTAANVELSFFESEAVL